MADLYKELRQMGVVLESKSIRETLITMCDAQQMELLREGDSEELEAVLERCMVPDFEDGLGDELAVRLILTGGLAIDPADMTVAQGHAVLAILAPKEG